MRGDHPTGTDWLNVELYPTVTGRFRTGPPELGDGREFDSPAEAVGYLVGKYRRVVWPHLAAPPRPTVAFCGHGRAGKDVAARLLVKHFEASYYGSLSWVGLPEMARRLGLPLQEAWETRHERRMEWREGLDDFRKDDPSRLIRMTLQRASVVVGVRAKVELLDAHEKKLLEHLVWVERPGTPPDPTLGYTEADAPFVRLDNDGTLDDLEGAVVRLGDRLGFRRRGPSTELEPTVSVG